MKYVILGTGAAGMKAARTIREFSSKHEIVMISSDQYVHSRCMLHKYISGERTEQQLNFTEDAFFADYNIHWIKENPVASICVEDKTVLLKDQSKVTYDKLLIATGANSFIPPVGDLRNASNVCGLRHLTDAQAIVNAAKESENILIIGSGLVGLDAAYGLLETGKNVTVVEMADQILPIQLDANGALEYQKRFEAAGCRFLLDRRAEKAPMNDQGKIEQVILDNGESVACDLIIVAAGVRPALSVVQDSPIAYDRGITVNEYMQTNIPDIYAAGDVTGLSGIWPNAMKQGDIAAKNMCGFKCKYDDTYAIKNTINFFGLVSLCIGRIKEQEDDEIYVKEDRENYKRIILSQGKVAGVLFQGNISNTGIWQYLIKNQIDVSRIKKPIFDISYADFYQIDERGRYSFKIGIND